MTTALRLRRRSLLKGLAALPLLRPRRAAAAPGLKYLVCVAQTGGYVQPSWRPPTGELTELPSSSQALTPYLDYLLFLPGLTDPSMASCTSCGHAAYTSLFYGLPSVTAGEYPEPGGPTVDQHVAGALPATSVRTLALATSDSGPRLSEARGYNRCFWLGADQPITPETNVAQTAARLFAGSTDLDFKRQLARRETIVRYQENSLQRVLRRLAGSDAMKVKAHLDAVSRVSDGLRDQSLFSGCGVAALPGPTDFPTMVKAQQDLIALALKCGVTRVVTWQLTDAGGANFDLPWLGVGAKTLHELAHGTTPAQVAAKAVADRYFMEIFAGLLGRLKDTPDPDGGTLLDHALVLWANCMEDGRTHDTQKLPWVLATGARARFRTRRCADSAGEPLTAVLASVCDGFGAKDHPFGAGLSDL